MAFALMLDSVRAIPARLAKSCFGHQRSRQKIVIVGALTPTVLPGFFLENRKQSQWHYKERQDQESEQEVIHRSLEVEDHIRGKSELIMPGSIVVYPFSIRMIITKLGAYGN